MRKTIGRLAAIGSLAAGLAFGLMGGTPAGAAGTASDPLLSAFM